MTLEELNRYRAIKEEIKAINEQIAELEFPLFSGGDRNGGKASGVSDPTKQAAFRIDDKERQLKERVAQYEAEGRRIDEWLGTVEKPEIRAIVRYRFLLGYRWKTVTEKVYGRNASRDLAQVNLTRFLKL